MDINYLPYNKLKSNTINGLINIQLGVQISDDIYVSYKDNLKNICYNEKKHLIDILLELKYGLEKKILTLIKDNTYIYKYINHIISDEWLLSINPIHLIDNEEIDFKYSDFYKLELLFKNDHTTGLSKNIKKLKENLINYCKIIEPTYMYVLLDLSSTNKLDYIKFNNISDKKLRLKSDINIRFINYIQILNLIKKELNIIINNCHSILKLIK
jgi:hypothetical protein